MGKFIEAFQEAVRFVFKLLTRGVEYADLALIYIKFGLAFAEPLLRKIREFVDNQDHWLDGLSPSLTEQEIEAKKEVAFKNVQNDIAGYFNGNVPKGIAKSLTEAVVYHKHHMEGDPRNELSRPYGILAQVDTEDEAIKKIVENGLNKGWGHGR